MRTNKRHREEREKIENVLITDAGAEGKSIAKHNGMVVFIPFGAPGDIVDVEITMKKQRYAEGKIIKIHSESPFREKPFCKHFGTCGGCKWQHLSYRQQLSTKQKHVKENMERIAKIQEPNMLPIIESDKTKYYRNKLEYTFGDKRWLSAEEVNSDIEFDQRCLGYHLPQRFDKLIDIEECFLQTEPSNEIRNAIKVFALENNIEFFNLRFKNGFARNIIIRSNNKGEIMLIWVVFKEDKEIFEKFVNFINAKFPEVISIYVAINDKLNDSLDNVPFKHLYGEKYLLENIEDLKFQIAPSSFFQTNTNQAVKLYQNVLKLAQVKGDELVFDLYTGTATIAAFFANHVKKVIGVEYIESSIEDGNKNLELNNIDNVELYHGDISKMFQFDWARRIGFPDIIITDPPRAGMTPSVVNTILELKPKKIIYISCNPATQARDLAEMTKEYDVVKIQPIDMFPQTNHVENIVLLHKKP